MSSLFSETSEPLDETEQARIVEEIQSEATAQSNSTRSLFAVVFLVIATIFVVCALHSIYDPWRMEHQRHFKEVLPHWVFLAYYLSSAFCFLIAASVVLDRTVTTAVVVSRYLAAGTAALVFVGWCKVFYSHNVSNPLLFWIPIVDLLGLGLAQYVHLDSKSLISMASDLQNSRYAHKTA